MTKHGRNEICIWQWPNVLSLDAALIAVLWQFLFGISIGTAPSPSTALVLALSVWLTYTADRLFDISGRPIGQLLSTRHQFAKIHSRRLWQIWWCTLLINISLALTTLSAAQLRKGFALLAICLLYTLLNQKLSQRFFPKQICVALIFSGGVIIFLSAKELWLAASSFTFLCLMNCLLISTKEIEIDQALGERTRLLKSHSTDSALFVATTSWSLIQSNFVTICTSICAVIYLGLSYTRNRFSVEVYRVLMDITLILPPAVAIGIQTLMEF